MCRTPFVVLRQFSGVTVIRTVVRIWRELVVEGGSGVRLLSPTVQKRDVLVVN